MAGNRKRKTKDQYVDPWEQQPGEGPEAFQAFVKYRDMSPKRSIREVARQVGKNPTLIARWSSRHDWWTRVAAWDGELDREAQDAQRSMVRHMNERHATAAMQLQELATTELVKLLAEAKKTVNKRGDLTVQEVLRFMTEGARLERTARGEPEAITRSEQTGAGGGKIGIDVDGETIADSAIERIAGRIAGVAARIGAKPDSSQSDGSGSPVAGS